jgi:Cu(I)/Ag(I) efflux system membrane fusion protein
MNRKVEWIVSAALIGTATLVVGAYTFFRGDAERSGAAAHQHGASASAAEAGPVRITAESARRIGVAYATAEFGAMVGNIRTVGQVTYDERRLTAVNPKIEGWVEQLFVDFTGAPVRKGQPLLAVYSPMLVSAQEELILARRLFDQAGNNAVAAANALELLEAARRRLSYWDIPADEIAHIENTGMAQKTLTLRAPASGLVVEKNIVAGARIMPGMDLYRIADLSTVWIEGEVFEKDLAQIVLGTAGQVTLESYPNRRLQARVSYVYPTITAASRTGRIRVELANGDLLLKPGMYATLEFEVPVHEAGVHVPRSAVLQTGERSLVFVHEADGALVPREVRIGFATADHVEILEGLSAGEVVVASANFLIDAESNLGSAVRATLQSNTQPPSANEHKHSASGNVPAARKQ